MDNGGDICAEIISREEEMFSKRRGVWSRACCVCVCVCVCVCGGGGGYFFLNAV